MKKTVLLAGKSCELLEELAREYLKAGYLVAASLGTDRASLAKYTEPVQPGGPGGEDTEGQKSETPADTPDNSGTAKKSGTPRTSESREGRSGEQASINPVLAFELNRRSPLSARTFVLRAITRFGGIDEAVVLNTAEGENRPLHELPAAAIEEPVDNAVKGTFFILRELLNHFWERKSGLLSLVSYSYGSDVLTPVDAAAAGSFRSLSESVFTYYENEPIIVNGFESQSSKYDEFARFVLTVNRDRGPKSHGKWFRHSERGGLLSGLPFSGGKR